MIFRALLLSLLLFGAFFGITFAALRLRYFTAGRVVEVVKTGSIVIFSLAATAVTIGMLVAADRYF